MKSFIAFLLTILMLLMSKGGASPASADDTVIKLREKDLSESSGLAFSIRRPTRFWSHNDSGGKSLLFAFAADGRRTGKCDLKSTKASDWEAMASYVQGGIPRLLIADCGDNSRKRKSINFYMIDEPDPDRSTDAKKIDKVSMVYPDGARDCEAVLVDPVRNQVLLFTKSFLPSAGLYVIPLPERKDPPKDKVVAKRIGTLVVPLITGADIDPISGEIWIVNYLQAFRFPCKDRNEPIAKQLAREPDVIPLPKLKQVEAIAINRGGEVWVTSEGSPTKMDRVIWPTP